MKNNILLIIFLIFSLASTAQQDTLETKFLLDFVTPDIPAYKSLGIEKSNLLRPSDVKEFALMLSPFYNNGKVGIPKNFGLEFAPWKMASRKWTLRDYDKKFGKRFLYNSSFSLAAVSDSTKYSSKLSIGYRFALLSNKADIIRIAFDKESDFSSKVDQAQLLKSGFRGYWIEKVVNPRPNPSELEEYFKNHQKEFYDFLASIEPKNKDLPDDLKALVFDTKLIFGDDFDFKQFEKLTFEKIRDALVEKLIADYKKQNWNADRLDAALAWVEESKDSSLSKTRFSSFNAWVTGALKIGKKGQLLIGANIKLPNHDADSTQNTPISFTASLRLLIGNSNFRFFGETQWQKINYGNILNSVLLNVGSELRISNKFWVVASSGIENLKEKANSKLYNRIVSGLDLRYGFNFK